MSILVKIFENDTVELMARKIWFQFAINQSCVITGYEYTPGIITDIKTKGQLVWERILEFDEKENFVSPGGKRRRKVLPCSNGAPEAHKIFCFRDDKIGGIHRKTIWRHQ